MPPRLACLAGAFAAALAFPGLALGGPPATPAPAPSPSPYPPDPNASDDPNAGGAITAPRPAAASSASADPVDIAHGRQAYKDFCQKCHGIDMVSPGPPFFDLRTFPKDEKPRFVDSVTHGKRAMPAWGAIVKPAEIESLWAYVSSYRPK